MVRKFLAVSLLLGFVSPVAAGPISVFTQVRETGGSGSDELRVSGLGTFAVLTTGGGVNPLVTVPADQTSAAQLVVGFWPVMGFRDRAHYEAERATVITIPETPVTLYAEVWNGVYGANPPDVRQVLIEAVISGTLGADLGQNSLDWRFINPPVQVDFGNAVVTVDYVPVPQPDGVPHIQFADGSPSIGFPGTHYYPTLLEIRVGVERDPEEPGPTDPPPGGGTSGGTPGVPEPASALLLAGLAVGGFVARSKAVRKG
jgi:hypothetical protein